MEKRLSGLLILAGIVMVVFAACGGSPADAVVGTWVSVEHQVGGERNENLEGMEIEFKDDGSAQTHMGPGTYVFEEDKVVYTSERGDEITYELIDDQLIVETFVVKIVYEKGD